VRRRHILLKEVDMPTMQLTAAYCYSVWSCRVGSCALPTDAAGFCCSMHHLMIIVCNFSDGAVMISIVCRATKPSLTKAHKMFHMFWGLRS